MMQTQIFDVVASKNVVPPENKSIFDVTPGTVCRVFFNAQYYRAKVIETGMLLYIHVILCLCMYAYMHILM